MANVLITDLMIARALAWSERIALWPIDGDFARGLLEAVFTEPDLKGKPTSYTPEMAERVLRRIAEGYSLREVSREPGMPAADTFLSWVATWGLFRQYAQARDTGIDVRFDDLRTLAASANQDNAAAIRVRVDVEKWALSKLKPGTYGDRLDLNVSGSLDIKTVSDATLNERVEARLRAKLEPVFARLEHPTLEDVLTPFKVTALPVTINHGEEDTNG